MGEQKEDSRDTLLGAVVGGAGRGERVVQVSDHIWVSKDVSDSILVTTPEGNVVINTGMPGNGEQHKQRQREISDQAVRYIVVTQCHGDHFGGVHEIRDPDTLIVTQENYERCREYWRILHDFYTRRSAKLWGSVLGEQSNARDRIREIAPDLTFRDEFRLELGGRVFELYAAPGGESEDGVIVWLPQDRTMITGNLFGPIFGNMPNLYTIRGDKIRSAKRFVESLELVRRFRPEVIVTGHEVIEGEEAIDAALERVRQAVLHVHDYTIDGMNAGQDVYTLMREVDLPEEIRIGQAHGKLSWCVRAIWEEYAGWFHYDATTSLYGIPAGSVAGDLVELAGGADALAERAECYLQRGDPLQALYLIDLALAAEPANRRALEGKIAAHQQLLEASGGENFSEVMWLRSEIAAAQRSLG